MSVLNSQTASSVRPFDNDERRAFRETAHRFVEHDILPYANEWDEAGDFPWDLHEKAGSLGMFGFGIDEAYGGLGFDNVFMRADISEALGHIPGGIAASLFSRNISTGPIQLLGTEDQKRRVLPDVMAGRTGSALAITEPGGGSDVANIKTTAKEDGDDYLISGSKTFITGGLKASHYVVGARTGDAGIGGISLFLVDWGTPGFDRQSVGDKMGWWGSDTATLFFDQMRVPKSAMLGPKDHGFIAIMNNFNFERLSMMAQCVGMMQAVYDDALAWARERETFGKPLSKHQVIRHKLVDMSTRIDTTRAYLERICWAMEQGNDLPVAEISKGKVAATTALEWCTSAAMQIMGGAGYLRGNRIERIYREVKVMAIGGGSEEIMRDLASRQMGL